ncbi:MAG: hypothetical protein QOI53_3416 [Verrucomicrobiota bacterium]|nr:hypothetical protein [Verrucomicrobiota bacterium]
MPIKATRSVVCHRPEQSPFHIAAMSRQRQVILNHPLGRRVNRDEGDFGPRPALCQVGKWASYTLLGAQIGTKQSSKLDKLHLFSLQGICLRYVEIVRSNLSRKPLEGKSEANGH